MKLGDILAGKQGLSDPMDAPSGVTLSVVPSKRLLEEIDKFCTTAAEHGKTLTREQSLLSLAAGGLATVKLFEIAVAKIGVKKE